ncbi:uncharacterized protein LOC101863565 [Aplysia californica]|uniref:Uncharacterized protein LOC101863565 n=1 Tax=Aplysia californica TaxID=6500 RepID=A0ABM0JE84_APLCA|nr:uncharacterized protein LOC101863565 [Aplysia californica]
MPGSFLAKYLPSRRQTDSFMMNGGIHHAGGNNKNSGHKASDATNITSGSSMDDPETPCDQAQIKFLPRTDSQRAARGVCRQWSTKEKYLLLLSAFLFLLCVAFVFLAFTRDLQLRDQLAESSKTKVCSTKACVSTALLKKIVFV